ncbi:cyanophycinase [Pedobacter sp. P351]|uniref:cyanophycinase n=1 Tax=Pedobacter superstes TaxID=3133441 RepID=UPI00309B6EFC
MVPKGKLIIIGGAVDLGSSLSYNDNISHPHYIKFFEKGILRRIITESVKGTESVVEVITTASKIPDLVGAEYIKSFNQLQVNNVHVLDIRTREQANDPEVLERVRNADVVMFSGGDQLRLTAIFGGTNLLRILKTRYIEEDFIIAGTSAGAAAASSNMIYRGSSSEALIKGEIQITGGLGFIDDVIVDTHFVQRGRIGRLFYAVATNPGMLGIGLGEDAGLLITDGVCLEAIGSGLTILVDGRYISQTSIYDVEIGSPVSIDNLKVHVMSIFDKYDLHKHELIINKAIKVEEEVYLKMKDKD